MGMIEVDGLWNLFTINAIQSKFCYQMTRKNAELYDTMCTVQCLYTQQESCAIAKITAQWAPYGCPENFLDPLTTPTATFVVMVDYE